MAGYSQEFRSRLIADGFAFSFGRHESEGRSLTFRVSAYRWRNTVFKIDNEQNIPKKHGPNAM